MTAATVSKNGDATAATHVIDYVAAVAELRANREDHSIVVNYDGHEFHVPSPLEWDDDAILAQEEAAAGNIGGAVRLVRALLGDQYAAFREMGGHSVDFMSIVGEELGKLGESSAS